MDLYVLRHGLAVEPDSPGCKSDADRTLTNEGKRKLHQIGAAMEALEITFDLILSSPYTRALQTAEIIAEVLDVPKKLQFTDHLEPGGDARKLVGHINGLRPRPGSILLVGHEPDLSRLISLLASGDSSLSISLKKAGFCKLSLESLRFGKCATLEWLLTPGQMRLMG
jgi:phosphohistidine phosphatase